MRSIVEKLIVVVNNGFTTNAVPAKKLHLSKKLNFVVMKIEMNLRNKVIVKIYAHARVSFTTARVNEYAKVGLVKKV